MHYKRVHNNKNRILRLKANCKWFQISTVIQSNQCNCSHIIKLTTNSKNLTKSFINNSELILYNMQPIKKPFEIVSIIVNHYILEDNLNKTHIRKNHLKYMMHTARKTMFQH